MNAIAMKDLPKSLKVKISISILWAVLVELFSGLIAGDSYSGFSFGAFLGVSTALNFPLLIYWLGFWVWGEGYLFKTFKYIFGRFSKYISIRKLIAFFLGLIAFALISKLAVSFINLFGASSSASARYRDNVEALAEIGGVMFGAWAAVWTYKRICRTESEKQTSEKKKIFPPLDKNTKILLLVYFFVILTFAYVIYDLSAGGAGYLFGNAIGVFLGAAIIMALASKFMKSPINEGKKLQATVAIAILLFVSNNGKEIIAAHDVKQFEMEMQAATPENWRDVINQSKTEIGQNMAAAIREFSKAAEIIANLDDEKFATVLSPDSLQNPEKILGAAKEKQTQCARAPAEIEKVYLDTFSKKEKFSRNMPKYMEQFWSSVEKTYNQEKPLTAAYIKAYANFYDNTVGMYEMLAAEKGAYTVSKDSVVTFSNNNVVDKYNAYFKGLAEASQKIAEITEGFKAKNKQVVEKFRHE
jgi:hypothetical protein